MFRKAGEKAVIHSYIVQPKCRVKSQSESNQLLVIAFEC